jgi:glycosyltransferase involved in cell wall biosynthesis
MAEYRSSKVSVRSAASRSGSLRQSLSVGSMVESSLRRAVGVSSDSEERLPRLSVVSPVYMAERILPELCRRLDEVLRSMAEPYEIILVCDGSPDRSWSVCEKLVKKYPHLIAVKLSRNFGQHYALTAGLDLARGEWTVVMDCDLQDRPEEIPRLLEKAMSGFDIVLARRVNRQHSMWKRKTSAWFFKVFEWISGMQLNRDTGCFRIMRRNVVIALGEMRESYRMFAGLVDWLGFKTGYIDVPHAARAEGKSSYSVLRLVRVAMDGIFSFSNRPLHISIALGVLISIASGSYGLYLILRAFGGEGPTPPGWLSTIIATSFLGGLILLNQGVLGVYLGRLYNQTKARPLYVIDRIAVGEDAYRDYEGDENG